MGVGGKEELLANFIQERYNWKEITGRVGLHWRSSESYWNGTASRKPPYQNLRYNLIRQIEASAGPG